MAKPSAILLALDIVAQRCGNQVGGVVVGGVLIRCAACYTHYDASLHSLPLNILYRVKRTMKIRDLECNKVREDRKRLLTFSSGIICWNN